MRYLHIVSAIVAIGGSSFVALCLLPATRLVDETFRESLLELVQKRFVKVLWFAIAGLVISGAYTWIILAPAYKDMGPKGNAVIGVKALLAVILFVIVWAYYNGMLKLKPKAYLMINLHIAAVVIFLGGLLRYWHFTQLPGN